MIAGSLSCNRDKPSNPRLMSRRSTFYRTPLGGAITPRGAITLSCAKIDLNSVEHNTLCFLSHPGAMYLGAELAGCDNPNTTLSGVEGVTAVEVLPWSYVLTHQRALVPPLRGRSYGPVDFVADQVHRARSPAQTLVWCFSSESIMGAAGVGWVELRLGRTSGLGTFLSVDTPACCTDAV